jgi:DNA-binding response OmpR family regulator
MTLTVGEDAEILPQKEFMLLYKLLNSAGKTFTRQQLMDEIWGADSPSDVRTVDVHINRLRERLRDVPDYEIVTIRGLGYKVVHHGN